MRLVLGLVHRTTQTLALRASEISAAKRQMSRSTMLLDLDSWIFRGNSAVVLRTRKIDKNDSWQQKNHPVTFAGDMRCTIGILDAASTPDFAIFKNNGKRRASEQNSRMEHISKTLVPFNLFEINFLEPLAFRIRNYMHLS